MRTPGLRHLREGSVARGSATAHRSIGPSAWIVLALTASCATSTFVGNIYRDPHTAFGLGDIPSTWHRFDLSGANLAFRDDSGGTILINGICEDIEDVSLDVLTNQALFGVEHQQMVSRNLITLDGRDALRTRLTGTMDGVPVELELVVVKKDNCTYDFQLVASPSVFSSNQPGFDRVVQGFHQLPRSGS
jgi:hypothetical protein